MSKNLLFIGGPYEAVPALGRAHALGYQVHVVDGNKDAPGLKLAQKFCWPWAVVSTYDAAAIINKVCHQRWVDEGVRLNGVVAVACDVAPVVSNVAEYFNLPHIPYAIASLSWHKGSLTRMLDEAGIPTPHGANKYTKLIIKPEGGRGARGVSLVKKDDETGYKAALYEAGRYCEPGFDIVEEPFIDGPQLSTESIVWEGKCVFTGITDRDYDFKRTAPRIIELGGWGPSHLDPAWGHKVRATIQKAVTALGIKSGTVKGDIVLDTRNSLRPTIIELAIGRMSGGYNCSHYLPLSYGVDFLGAAYAVACGDDPDPHLCWADNCTHWHVRGLYANADGATSHPERGRFKMYLGKTRAEAEATANLWTERLAGG